MQRVKLSSPWSLSFNLTPMIDIIFQLIIFFLCVSQFEKAEQLQQIDLPQAESKDRADAKSAERLTLTIKRDGTMLLGGVNITMTDLELAIKTKSQPGRPVRLWIRGDRKLEFKSIQEITNLCAKLGVTKVEFKVTEPSND